MKTRPKIILLLCNLLIVLAGAAALIVWGGNWVRRNWAQGHKPEDPVLMAAVQGESRPGQLQPLWDAPAFSFTDQEGRRVSENELRGHPWVADFIFTQCSNACPLMTAKMVLLQREVKEPNVRFISFSVDPQHDTREVLKQYAKEWNDDPRWHLLQTDEKGLQQIVEGMKVSVEKTDEKENPILHSNLFFLIDSQGKVRGLYNSGDDQAMHDLAADLARLAGGSSQTATTSAIHPPENDITAGGKLFAQFACAACHSQSRLAPSLAGVFGRSVMLEDKKVIQADDAYLRESILEPNAKVVAGYSGLMPSYRGFVSDPQLGQMISYIKSLPAAGGSVASTQPASRELLVDVVCRMKVRVDPKTPHADYHGKEYYFCSDTCREKFLKDPVKYLQPKATQPSSKTP